MSKFEVISGVEGCCLALDDTRIAGPKPWGGGTVIHVWETDKEYKTVDTQSRWFQLFGTPESAARTVAEYGKTIYTCDECLLCHDHIGATCEINGDCPWVDGESGYDALLEWLKGGSDG